MFRFNPEQVGERLHALRRRHGQTLRDLGALADVNYVTLSKIERGKMPQVSADIVVRLAVALGVSVDDLLGVPLPSHAAPSAPQQTDTAQVLPPPRPKRQRSRQAASVA